MRKRIWGGTLNGAAFLITWRPGTGIRQGRRGLIVNVHKEEGGS